MPGRADRRVRYSNEFLLIQERPLVAILRARRAESMTQAPESKKRGSDGVLLSARRVPFCPFLTSFSSPKFPLRPIPI